MDSKKLLSKPAIELFVISMLSLFFELVVIRWLSSEIRIFAYFKNIPLMACLFGMGMGMALSSSKKDWEKWFPYGLLVITAIICFAVPLNLVHVSFLNPMEHYLPGDFIQKVAGAAPDDSLGYRLKMFLPGLAVLIVVFYLIVFTFVCIGQKIGRLLNEFEPLKSYTINIVGSLVGIALFTIISFLSWPPVAWILIGCIPAAWFYRKPTQIVSLVACVALSYFMVDPKIIWSPYYRISVGESHLPAEPGHPGMLYGYEINVNYDTIEGAYNNDPAVLAKLSESQRKLTADYYDTPYLALGAKPRSVLVLAAGTGNDVAAALRYGATDVDCVEIDPAIAELGKKIHPEQPYSNPKVHIIVDDARAYLRRCKKKYDLVVFAYLDSHTAFSSMSSLRLDNYVYTTESFQDAARLLKSDGVMSVTFYCMRWWQLAHVYNSVQAGTGYTPIGVFSKMNNGPTLLLGPGLDKARVEKCGLTPFTIEKASKEWGFQPSEWPEVSTSTDDWPYIFLRERGLTWVYSVGLLFTLSMGITLIGRTFGKFTNDSLGRAMFFLGAAFMLVETKSVNQMGLLAGTTWIVNSCVFTAILLMILLANFLQLKFRFQQLRTFYVLLFLALIASYFFPLSVLNGLPVGMGILAGSVILSAPIFFAAIIFAATFSRVTDTSKALGMNLLGTLAGGVLEYLSMVTGTNALNLLAAGLYGLAYYCTFSTPSNSSLAAEVQAEVKEHTDGPEDSASSEKSEI